MTTAAPEPEPEGPAAPGQFPVLLDGPTRRKHPLCPRAVPWDMVRPHDRQAKRNHGQSLKRLASRGGLHPVELLAVLDARPFPEREYLAAPDTVCAGAIAELIRRAAAWLTARAKPAAEMVRAWAWVCKLCHTENAERPDPLTGRPPLGVQCRFCKTVHTASLPAPGPEEDAPAPQGAADSPHVQVAQEAEAPPAHPPDREAGARGPEPAHR